jgi:hypothetical protein
VSVAENAALGRRVAGLEANISAHELVLVRTTLVVCERGHEADYATAAEAIAAAEHVGPNPPVRELRRFVDLELLIDPVTSTRRLRHRQKTEAKRDDFDRRAASARIVEVEIRCHERQLSAIISTSPIEAVFGGNRAGKSMALAWWIFRRWMLRGGVGSLFWWIGPTSAKAVQFGAWLIAGLEGLGDGALWPLEVFAGLTRIGLEAKNPIITMIDGSVLAFNHAHHSGRRGGDNLRSANVRDIVVDELTSIHDQKNWQQLIARVSQSGGHILTASTRGSRHWSRELIEGNAATAGGSISVSEVDLFHNPWMAYGAIWQMFLNDKTFTRHQLEEILALPRPEQADAARARVTRPESLLNHFGISAESNDRLWSEWAGDRVIADRDTRHPAGLVVTAADGTAKRLRNITAAMLATKWQRATRDEKSFTAWAGMDFNFVGHTVLFELFGEGPTEDHALADQSKWVVLVVDEIEVTGTTLRLAEALAKRAGTVPIWCDPTGAMNGHEARGTAGSTDIAELRKHGHAAQPANGHSRSSVSRVSDTQHLSVTDSRNVIHALMADGRLYVHSRCAGLLDALEHDKPTKTSGVHSQSDIRSGYSDAMRYGLWPVFKHLGSSRTKTAAA